MERTQRPYELMEYDPAWNDRFDEAADKLRPILGDNLISIEHIGSTSIEGMVAKPQIDILAVVKDLDRVPDMYQAFRRVGYIPQGREYVGNGDEYVTEDASDGRRVTSIHIFPAGNPKIEEYRIFRDYLKTHSEDRELYIATKRKLYGLHQDEYVAYDQGKKDVIQQIKDRAREWAAASS